MTPFRIALLGAPRSGKTCIARELGALLGCPEDAEPDSSSPLFHFDDNPPLLKAISAKLDEQGMVQAAEQHAIRYHMTLLMGLDLMNDTGAVSAGARQFDVAIRNQLASAGIAYQVIYGEDRHRTAHALQALAPLYPRAALLADDETGTPAREPANHARAGGDAPRWVWVCEKCSDPVCEHRLLADLLSQRSAANKASLQR